MSDTGAHLDCLKSAPRPCVYMFGWPEPVTASEDVLRAAIFAGETTKICADVLVLRADGRILSLTRFQKGWRVGSGDFVGNGSAMDRLIVKTDQLGVPIPRKKWFFQRLAQGTERTDCTWKQALDVAFHFLGHGPMPSGLVWLPWAEAI